MRVDQRRAHRRPLAQPQLVRSGFVKACAQRRAGCDDLVSDLRIAVGGEIAKTDTLEIAFAPAPLVSQKIPFTGERANRTRRRSWGAERKIVGEFDEVTVRTIPRLQLPLQSKHLAHCKLPPPP